MNNREDNNSIEDYIKPTRQQSKNKKKKGYKDKEEVVPKDVYKRQRLNPRNLMYNEDEFDDNY